MDFYYLPASGPCRSVQMTAEAVGVDLNLKFLDLMAGDQLKPEFIEINPQHTVPTLVDSDFVLWESRAIMIYLVERYAKDDSLYPRNPQQQAVVNQRLFFDMGTLQHRFTEYYYPQIFRKQPADPDKFKRMEEAFSFMNKFLEEQEYAAGDRLTIADIALVTTVSTYEAVKFNISKYPNVEIWYNLMKNVVPGYDIIFRKQPADPDKFKRMEEAFSFMNKFLEEQEYAAGDRLTIADIALVTTVSTYEAVKFNISKYPNVEIWYNLMKNVVPGYDINQKGVEEYKKFLKMSGL